MKNQRIQLQIPEPCHEKWSEMTPTEKGQYCKSCDKILVDFTAMSDRQLLDYFQNYNGKLCGRMKKSQLDRPVVSLPSPSFTRSYAASGLLAASLLAGGDLVAQQQHIQDNVKIEHSISSEKNAPIKGEIVMQKNDTPFYIKGKVTDITYNEDLIGCSVSYRLLNASYEETINGTYTDIDGTFSLQIPAEYRGETISVHFHFVGYNEKSVVVNIPIDANSPKEHNIVMEMDESEHMLLGEICFVETSPVKKTWNAIKYFPRKVAYWTGRAYEDTVGFFNDQSEKRKTKKAEKQKEKVQKNIENRVVDNIQTALPTEVPKKESIVQNISPNPTSDYLRVSLNLEEKQRLQFNLLNVLGTKVLEYSTPAEACQNEYEMQLPKSLAAGSYFLQVLKEDGSTETYPIIINKP